MLSVVIAIVVFRNALKSLIEKFVIAINAINVIIE